MSKIAPAHFLRWLLYIKNKKLHFSQKAIDRYIVQLNHMQAYIVQLDHMQAYIVQLAFPGVIPKVFIKNLSTLEFPLLGYLHFPIVFP